MNRPSLMLCVVLSLPGILFAADTIPVPSLKLPPAAADKVITEQDVTAARVGDSIPACFHRRAGQRGQILRAALGGGCQRGYATVDGSMRP